MQLSTRNRIIGAIAAIWGGGILLSFLTGTNSTQGNGAYGAGQITGLVFGALIFALGIYWLIKGSKK